MINEGMFTSNVSGRNTPKWLLEHLYEAFEFDLDPCSDKGTYDNPNVRAFTHYTIKGLERPWFGVVFMNPPYGREIPKWFSRAANGIRKQQDYKNCGMLGPGTVVCLVPARTDTQWWHNHIRKASFAVFIKGRLKFGDEENSAPFPSAIVVFGEISSKQKEHLAKLGWEVTP
jgi:hypothetical protein